MTPTPSIKGHTQRNHQNGLAIYMVRPSFWVASQTCVVPRDLTSIAPLGTSAGRHPCRNAWRHFSMTLHSSSRLFYCPSIFSLTGAPPSSALVNGVSALPYLCGDNLSQCYTVVAAAFRFAPGVCHVALCIFFTVLGTADALVSSCSAHIPGGVW